MKLNKDKKTAGQKAAFTKKWQEASRKAHRTRKNAITFTSVRQYVALLFSGTLLRNQVRP